MSNLVNIEKDRVTNVSSTDFPGYDSNTDYAWDLQKFKDTLEIKVGYRTDRTLNFDLIHIDTSIANAFRRIMISEVPSVSVEHVYINNNSSVIQDEVLASRIGLVPLQIDPDRLSWVDRAVEESERFTDENTVVVSLNVACTKNPHPAKNNNDPENLYRNSIVYSRDLKFEPQGRQVETFADSPVVAADPDIVIAKLRPGQEISLKAHCILGLGSDHAKFSPVCTASYRLLPVINITQPITGKDAEKFQKCFPKGVIAIEDDKAVVKDARRDTVSRECLRHPEFEGKVKLARQRDHFIFNVESTGCMPPEEIFFKSVRILKNKAEYLKNCPIGNMN
ncbi:BA75_04482T0 [Komagataella pastoris]|uniref:DNA-directed RNA polymerases I and III subunit RPAC1 n=1 Tax=Komagataella pastoris TaxID=4922 RepID=A0A1B2JJK1_PICPA|nr:BA75_04482T0 [Komagataella pastoris]